MNSQHIMRFFDDLDEAVSKKAVNPEEKKMMPTLKGPFSKEKAYYFIL